MRTIKLVVAYDGSGYRGFQKQKNVTAVQNVLEEVLSKLCGEKITTVGSGRTDTGVHALAQTVSFTTNGRIPCANIVRAAEKMLPPDIVIISAEEVQEGFHARISACWKRYLYRILENEHNDPCQVRYAWQLRQKLDLEAMNEAAAMLLGTHDFSAFRSSGSVDSSPVKTMYEAKWQRSGNEVRFTVGGDGFLYHMVRNLVWSMVQIGFGLRTPQDFARELTASRCEFLNEPAPPQGLYLQEVFYEPYALIETERLYLRKLQQEDLSAMSKVLQNEKVMYAWEHAFSAAEVAQWLQDCQRRYEEDGFGYLAVMEKKSGKFIGMAGPLMENIDGSKVPGIGYILDNAYWQQGYAVEAARGSVNYLLSLGYKKIVAEIRPENHASRRVAEKLGMQIEGELVKHYRGKDMPHLLYFYCEKNLL